MNQLLNRQEEGFLLNYLNGRAVFWHFEEPIRKRFPNIESRIDFFLKSGNLFIDKSTYKLSEMGEDKKCAYRMAEKLRERTMKNNVLSLCLNGDFIEASQARIQYEIESVIPHGIGSDWSNTTYHSMVLKRYIQAARELDLSDSWNTIDFKNLIRAVHVASHITVLDLFEAAYRVELEIEEKLLCPDLESQLKEKCFRPNPPKLYIYMNTKFTIKNLLNTKSISKWDGKYILGPYDCSDPFHAAIAEFERCRELGIDGFPKTFQTYYKHKKRNSEKYQNWISQYESIKNRP